jgi:putative ABC transport system permease protein
MRFKIAWRNTFRNRRRSALNLLMIAGGVSSIILFEGFAHNLLVGLRETTIRTQSGHLQVATRAFWKQSAKNPKNALLPNYEKLIHEIYRNPHVTYASGRLSFFGLLSHGDQSISAKGVSFDPAAERERARAFRFISGRGLKRRLPYEVALGAGLAKRMRLRAKDRVSLLVYTYDGQVNALDVEVCGIFRTSIAEFDDNTFLIPLSSAQKLMDIRAVEQIVVGLDSTANTHTVLAELGARLPHTTGSVKIKPWYTLAQLFTQVSSFTEIQNRVVELIILSLVLLGIMNTIGMSVAERATEIGTARALGEPEAGILHQFLLEGLILGLIGSALGTLLGIGMAEGVNALRIPVVMPGASAVIHLKVDLVTQAIRDASALAVVAAVVAAFVPALKASRLRIVDALRKNS